MVFPNALRFSSIDEAIDEISNKFGEEIETLIAVGGTQIYKESFKSKYFHRLYLTRIFGSFVCDTYLEPENFLDNMSKLSIDELKSEQLIYECDYNLIKNNSDNNSNIEYIFEIYEKNINKEN